MQVEDYFVNERGSNHQLLKQNNNSLVKRYMYRNSPISRVEIAQQLGLTTATITGMVNPGKQRHRRRRPRAQAVPV